VIENRSSELKEGVAIRAFREGGLKLGAGRGIGGLRFGGGLEAMS